jgi:hypothetical protein
MSEKNKPAEFKIGQRVLFRLHARPALWLSGTIIGGPASRKGKVLYQVKLDNGESRSAATDNFAMLDLSPGANRKPRCDRAEMLELCRQFREAPRSRGNAYRSSLSFATC